HRDTDRWPMISDAGASRPGSSRLVITPHYRGVVFEDVDFSPEGHGSWLAARFEFFEIIRSYRHVCSARSAFPCHWPFQLRNRIAKSPLRTLAMKHFRPTGFDADG